MFAENLTFPFSKVYRLIVVKKHLVQGERGKKEVIAEVPPAKCERQKDEG